MSTVFPDRSVAYEEKRDGRRKEKNVHVYVRVYMTRGERERICVRACVRVCVRAAGERDGHACSAGRTRGGEPSSLC